MMPNLCFLSVPDMPKEITQAADADELPADYLFGNDQIEKRGSKKKLSRQGGVIVVESQQDVERLQTQQLLSVGLVHSPHTPEQVQRIAALARKYAEAKVQTWLPLNRAGRLAMWKLVQELLPEVFVKVPITSTTNGGAFANKTPRDLTDEQLKIAAEILRR